MGKIEEIISFMESHLTLGVHQVRRVFSTTTANVRGEQSVTLSLRA